MSGPRRPQPAGLAPLAAACACLLASGLPRLSGDEPMPPQDQEPPPQYEARRIEGWTVLVNERFLKDQPDLAARTLTLLQHQLYQVTRRVPAGPLKKLKTVRIWVEETSLVPCSTYHPNPEWLREHGLSPKKARCIELANARNFLEFTKEQPWMLLHELAHAYHHQFLEDGFENAEIKAAFQKAASSHLYDSVLRANGHCERAYATNNPMEYFAEASEAFFGSNDFYPFVRSELQRHDPDMADLLYKLWQVPRK